VDALTQRLTQVAKALNSVQSTDQAVAAIRAARDELARGRRLAGGLSGEATSFLGSLFHAGDAGTATKQNALAELQGLSDNLEGYAASLPDHGTGEPVDRKAWGTAAPASGVAGAIAKIYASVAGVEGALGTIESIDVAGILGQSIREAPGVFLDGAKVAIKAAGDEARDIVGSAIGGWWWLLAILAVVAFGVFSARRTALGAVL